jgi:hypothetical protein
VGTSDDDEQGDDLRSGHCITASTRGLKPARGDQLAKVVVELTARAECFDLAEVRCRAHSPKDLAQQEQPHRVAQGRQSLGPLMGSLRDQFPFKEFQMSDAKIFLYFWRRASGMLDVSKPGFRGGIRSLAGAGSVTVDLVLSRIDSAED